ncbi:uncharacterized protein LOC129942964 [Eupeodes corollae]|uniref:uncharacterized protein LOC129942964 n=1 Tax=Eupeodes corollae TaxID=290404 RepID=UPI002493C474|nr:uncharacterized protein LOC129942964 [Eupeodes corollae]
MIAELIVLVGLAAFLIYKWSTSTFDFFEKRNLPYKKPLPFVGNQKDFIFRKVSMFDNVRNHYNQFDTKIFGLFDLRSPAYAIRDPELLKRITIKEFDHFVNHRIAFRDGGLLDKAVNNLRDQRWKDMRSTLSPVFTGSKMRQIFVLINEVARESMEFLKKNREAKIDFNIKDYFTRFTNDVIASAVFGIKVNSYKEDTNEFYVMGRRITHFSIWQNMIFFVAHNLKPIMRFFKIQLFDKKDTNYFLYLVMDAMRYRQKNKIFRPDMVNMMMEARGLFVNEDKKSSKSNEWTDDEIVAQFFIFFFAGFEPTSVLMCFAAHELMVNPDCQERLREEIREVKASLDGKPLTYEILQGMKYMDMVISETLRRWPPATVTDRQCNKDFHYKDDDVDVTIKAGDYIWIPIAGYHMDEKYFPNPTKFDPERFSDENKGNIQPCTYVPFGIGPRICIANRFALLEAKSILFYLLSEFEIQPSHKSSIPMELTPGGINLGPKNGFWMKLVQLSNESYCVSFQYFEFCDFNLNLKMLFEFLVLLGLTLFLLYKWLTAYHGFFEKIGIPYAKPFPPFGCLNNVVFRKISMFDCVNNLYKKFNTSIFGIFEHRYPVFVIRDPALLKSITVKDFDHFKNHRPTFEPEDGGLFGDSLFFMRNDRWKDMRSTLTPIFTGSKMRQMFVLINEVAKESIDFLKLKCERPKEIDFDIKDFFTKFTNDTIASAVFGLKVNSFKEEQNEFYQMGKRVTVFTALQNIKFFLSFTFKPIMRFLKIELFDRNDSDYFVRLVLDAMKYREQNKIMRPDMVNMMMEANGIFIDKNKDDEAEHKPTTNRKWSDYEIVAQFFLFFFAGFESTSNLMAFAVTELMKNPDCQEKLRQEVLDVIEALDGEPLTYEALHGMKYMDMVISETLRRWPLVESVDRRCNKDFSYKDNDVNVTIKAGDAIWIPIVGYHLDENYFPDPLKFDPERFSDENKSNIKPFTYLPFGVGPRNCIGSRFALIEAKAMLFYILSHFRIEISPKTILPTELVATGLNLMPKGGFRVKLVPLNMNNY